MSKPTVWMPFFVGDYLGDTMSFDATEHGAYLLLILEYWRNGPLPNDMKILGKICRLSNKTRSIVLQSVLLKFQLVNNEWRHKRIDLELQLANENQAIYVERAKKAAEARWKGHTSKDATSITCSTPNAMLENASPSPSPSPSIKKKITTLSKKKISWLINLEKVKLTNSQYESLVAEFGLVKVRQFIENCADYCKSKGITYKDYAATMRTWERKNNSKPTQQPMFNNSRMSQAEKKEQFFKEMEDEERRKRDGTDQRAGDSIIEATFQRLP